MVIFMQNTSGYCTRVFGMVPVVVALCATAEKLASVIIARVVATKFAVGRFAVLLLVVGVSVSLATGLAVFKHATMLSSGMRIF